jgi:hypothetical protein
MKDERDTQTGSSIGVPDVQSPIPHGRGTAPVMLKKHRYKFLPRHFGRVPEGAKAAESGNPYWPMHGRSVVPVSSVARDWGISSRRVRVMLAEGRLEGRQLENGYWEVFYPYRYVIGTRGPSTTRQKNTPPRPKKAERMTAW